MANLKPGYYFQRYECYHSIPNNNYSPEMFYISGKKTGNRIYNVDADEPRWDTYTADAWAEAWPFYERNHNSLKGWMYSKSDPVPHYVTYKWKRFLEEHCEEVA